MQHYQLHQEKIKYVIVLIGTIFLLTSHDQHVWSWTQDHTPANLTISYPGMI